MKILQNFVSINPNPNLKSDMTVIYKIISILNLAILSLILALRTFWIGL